MSAFLGPIHHWLFNKIKLHEDLERALLFRFEKEFGNTIQSIAAETIQSHGAPLEERPLDQLIDLGNIHGWLQNRIAIAETRQADLLTRVFKAYGDKALSMALEAYEEQGKESGLDAQAKGQTQSAPALYKALNNYLLDGMPCDNANSVITAEPDFLQWKTMECLHKAYWEKVGADTQSFYKLRHHWIKAFIEKGNSDFQYSCTSETIKGQSIYIHEIKLK